MFRRFETGIRLAFLYLVIVLAVFFVRELHRIAREPAWSATVCTTDSDCQKRFGGNGDPEPIR